MTLSTIEFAVNLTCENCVKNVTEKLQGVKGIEKFHISLEDQTVVLDTRLPSFEVQRLIEKTGKKAILKGYSSSEGKIEFGSAVAMLAGESGFSSGIVRGVVRFVQLNKETCVVEGTIDGLSPGEHGFQIHECGDISKGCDSVGEIFNLRDTSIENATNHSIRRLTGDLGDIKANDEGRSEFRFEDSILKVWDIIGRSLVITNKSENESKVISNESDAIPHKRLACAIIARSAGLFENSKKICACDGVSIWDERDRPLSGPGRRLNNSLPSEGKTNESKHCSLF